MSFWPTLTTEEQIKKIINVIKNRGLAKPHSWTRLCREYRPGASSKKKTRRVPPPHELISTYVIPTLTRAAGMLGTGFPESPGKPTIAWKGPASASLLEKRNERLLEASGCAPCAHAARPQQARRGVARSACWPVGGPLAHHTGIQGEDFYGFFSVFSSLFFLQNKRNIHFYLGHYYKQQEKENKRRATVWRSVCRFSNRRDYRILRFFSFK